MVIFVLLHWRHIAAAKGPARKQHKVYPIDLPLNYKDPETFTQICSDVILW